MSLYDRPGIAATYRAARALPAETVRVWVDAIRHAIGHLTVRLAVDIGAGTGRFTRVLATAAGGRVIAIEPPAGMVEEREVIDVPAVRYVRAVGEALPLQGGTADVALLSMDAFRDVGFTCRDHTVVWQRIANDLAEYAARIRARSFSSMRDPAVRRAEDRGPSHARRRGASTARMRGAACADRESRKVGISR
jgi:SAM-dependent methyltransferase